MDTGSNGHHNPPCIFLGGPSAASDLRVCGLEDEHRESERDDLAASTWSREQGAGSTGPCWQLILCSISMTPITMASESLAAPG